MNKKVSFQLPPLGKQHAKQAMNKGVQQVQNPVTKEMATEKITQVINQSGMPPSMLAKIGKLAEESIHDKKKYQNFVNFMVQHKLETAESLKKPDFQMLASMAVIGKVAETMPDKQAVGAPAGMATQIQGM
jgi:hypothetical protein